MSSCYSRKRIKRSIRVRNKIRKVSKCPRLSVFRSNQHIYCQIINDKENRTLVAVNSMQKDFVDLKKKYSVEAAKAIGKKLAEKASQAGLKQLVFDKGGYKYHGRVKAIAETVREHGIVI